MLELKEILYIFSFRYMVYNNDAELWEQLLLAYRSNREETQQALTYTSDWSEDLSLEDQFFVLTSLPN